MVVRDVSLTPLARYYFPDAARALAAVSCFASIRPVYDQGDVRVYRLSGGG